MCNCTQSFDNGQLYTWCTNCGNYGIHAALKRALTEENLEPHNVLLCFDIGCHGNGADKIEGYTTHGLHGRVLPFAAGAAIANNNLKVLAFGGDGGTLSEGISHLIHSIRANYNVTFVLHDNSNYALTTGQASSTTRENVPMNSSPYGVTSDPLKTMEMVLALDPSFAARAFSGNVKHTTEVLRKAINHKGFSFVEILQSCPTYNKATTQEWYLERIYDIAEDINYNVNDLNEAKRVALDLENKIATGVLYVNNSKKDFYSRLKNRGNFKTTLIDEVENFTISKLLQNFI